MLTNNYLETEFDLQTFFFFKLVVYNFFNYLKCFYIFIDTPISNSEIETYTSKCFILDFKQALTALWFNN